MVEYITRNEAIVAICKDCLFKESTLCEVCRNKSQLYSVPVADVRPVVKAYWYWDKNGMDRGIGAWRCSACKAKSPMWWNTDRENPMHKSGHRFCPNCGATMEKADV